MGRSVVLVLCCAAASGAIGGARAHAVVPSTKTCKASALGFTLVLPSDWVCGPTRATGSESRFVGDAPAAVAWLDVYTTTAAAGVPLSAYAARLVAAARQQFKRAGTGLVVTSSDSTIGSAIPALLVVARYHGLWLQGSGERGEITHMAYFFLHRGVLYEFDYSSITPWATKYLPVFAASARSIHFLSRLK